MADLERIARDLRAIGDPELLLARIVADTNFGVVVFDEGGAVTMANDAFARIFGVRPPADYCLFEDENFERLGLSSVVARMFDGETVHFGPIWYDPRDLDHVALGEGRRAAVDALGFGLADAGGRVRHAVAVFADNTELHAVHEELNRSDARFRALIDNAVDGIALIDGAGVVQFQSPAITRVLGYDVDEDIGRNALDQVHPDDRAELAERVAGLLRHRESKSTLRYRVRHKDRSWRWIESRVTNMVHDPAVGALVFNYRDVTADREAAEEIRRLNADLDRRVKERTGQLEEAVAELEAFTYTVSHDLRSPLRAIDGYAAMLAGGLGDGADREAGDFLDAIRGNARRMGHLIDDLLALSRLGRRDVKIEPVDTAKIARQAVASLASEIDGDDVAIDIAELPPCRADPGLLRQLFVNLLTNAVKYRDRSRAARIDVGHRCERGESLYFVRDNGVGFDMRYAEKVFGVFERLHAADEYAGTGIGLAVVHRIVQRHGGRAANVQ